MSLTTIIVYLTLGALLFTQVEVAKIKKENHKLKEEILAIKTHIKK
ncbi:hypothetical protein [Sporosarcina sp. G11-34]|nr:hypothetical protein [Sporosarcina sp. G11-34]MCZ2260928.1 hypothetical protein [Sporosarcina sp. G11-34]